MKRLLHVVLVWALAISPLHAGVGEHIKEHIILGGIEKSTATTVNCNNSAPDDSDLLAASITKAAVNGTLALVPGKTCLVDRQITLLAGQTVIGYGATIKRRAQISTTTTTSIPFIATTNGTTTNITSVVVADTTGLDVGQEVAVFNGTDYSYNVTISNISGTTVTFATALKIFGSADWTTGTKTLVLSFNTIRTVKGNKIYGVTFDGNYANYTKYRWENNSEIKQNGSLVTIEDTILKDVPGEGIQESSDAATTTTTGITTGTTTAITVATGTGSNYVAGMQVILVNGANWSIPGLVISSVAGDVITFTQPIRVSAGSPWSGTTTVYSQLYGVTYNKNVILNVNGNGMHFSASYGTVVSNNYIDNTNLQGDTVGHTGGSVTYSTAVRNILITNNVLSRGRTGIGQMNSGATSYSRILENTIINPVRAGIEMVNGTTDNPVTDVTIQENQFFLGNLQADAAFGPPSGTVTPAIYNSTSYTGTYYPARINIVGNAITYSVAPTAAGGYAVNLQKMVGLALNDNTIEFASTDSGAATNTVGFNITTLTSAGISGNRVKYGFSGFSLVSGLTDVSVTNNTITNTRLYGIYHGTGGSNVLISGNLIQNDSTADNGSYQGIALNSAATVVGNTITLNRGYTGIRINGVANCRVRDNYINSGTAASLSIEAGSTLFNISNNVLSKAMTYNATAGAGNIGTATVANGTTSIAVTHNLGYTPDVTDIQITPTLMSLSKTYWISAIGASTFTINVDVDPGVGTATFAWKING